MPPLSPNYCAGQLEVGPAEKFEEIEAPQLMLSPENIERLLEN